MPSWCNKANAYTSAWCLYYLQGTLYSVGSFFSQLLLAILLLVSLYYCFVANVRYKLPIYFWGLNALVLILSTYGLFLMFGGFNSVEYDMPVKSFEYLKGVFISLLPIYSFYVFFVQKKVSDNYLFVWVVIFLLVSTVDYFENQNAQLIAAIQRHSSAEEFTNNAGYKFLALIPACALLYKKPVIQYIIVVYCTIYMLMSMKRGAIVICGVVLIWFVWNNIKNSRLMMKIGFIALSLVLCITCYEFIQNKMENSLYFQKRIENTLDGNSSGRDVLYNSLANYFWNETTSMQFIFGSGANATLQVVGDYAHNDWLEIAVNQGVLGLLVYVIYWMLFCITIKSSSLSPYAKLALQILFMIYFLKSLFSMSYGAMAISATFVLGYCLAQISKGNKKITIKNEF